MIWLKCFMIAALTTLVGSVAALIGILLELHHKFNGADIGVSPLDALNNPKVIIFVLALFFVSFFLAYRRLR